MRKRIIGFDQQTESREEGWLDIGNLAEIELSSEDRSFPIESAILPVIHDTEMLMLPRDRSLS
jgi:hypothetical protein